MKPLLVGPAPGPRAPEGYPAFGPAPGSGRRLARLLGLPDIRLVFDTTNLLTTYPGRAVSGDRFPVAIARERALELVVGARPFVLLAGQGVARAFGLSAVPLRWQRLPGGIPAAVIPHPSGLNRWWNDPDHATAARSFIEEALCSTSRS